MVFRFFSGTLRSKFLGKCFCWSPRGWILCLGSLVFESVVEIYTCCGGVFSIRYSIGAAAIVHITHSRCLLVFECSLTADPEQGDNFPSGARGSEECHPHLCFGLHFDGLSCYIASNLRHSPATRWLWCCFCCPHGPRLRDHLGLGLCSGWTVARVAWRSLSRGITFTLHTS